MTDQLDDISFFRTFAMVLGVLVLLAVVFAIVANMVTSEPDSKGVDKLAMQAVEERLAPLASVSVGAASSGDDAAPAPTTAPPPANKTTTSTARAATTSAGVVEVDVVQENRVRIPGDDHLGDVACGREACEVREGDVEGYPIPSGQTRSRGRIER